MPAYSTVFAVHVLVGRVDQSHASGSVAVVGTVVRARGVVYGLLSWNPSARTLKLTASLTLCVTCTQDLGMHSCIGALTLACAYRSLPRDPQGETQQRELAPRTRRRAAGQYGSVQLHTSKIGIYWDWFLHASWALEHDTFCQQRARVDAHVEIPLNPSRSIRLSTPWIVISSKELFRTRPSARSAGPMSV